MILKGAKDSTLEISFTPNLSGIFNDKIIISYSDCRSKLEVNLSGEGVIGPVLALKNDSIDFDTTFCGTTKIRYLVIKNKGDIDLIIDSISQLMPPFRGLMPLDPILLKPNDSINYPITFTPENAPKEYEQSLTLKAKGQILTAKLHGRGVKPVIKLSSNNISFSKPVRYGDFAEQVLTIKNEGDAPLVFKQKRKVQNCFIIGRQLDVLNTLFPNEQMMTSIKFSPSKIGAINDLLTLEYKSCIIDSVSIPLSAIGYDSATISLTSNLLAKPGSTIFIPVYLTKSIPYEYQINNYSLSVKYNKTVLHPIDGNPIIKSNTLSEVFSSTKHTTTYDTRSATTKIELSGGTLVNPTGEGLLVNLGFTVLLGNSCITDINLLDAKFADGNLYLKIIEPGSVKTDSICNPCDRLIDASERWGTQLYQNAPNPFNPSTKIWYSIKEDGYVSLKIYDVSGRLIKELVNNFREAGKYEILFDAKNLPSGIYFYEMSSGNFRTVNKMILLK